MAKVLILFKKKHKPDSFIGGFERTRGGGAPAPTHSNSVKITAQSAAECMLAAEVLSNSNIP